MISAALEDLLYRLDKEPDLLLRFKNDPKALAAGFALYPDEIGPFTSANIPELLRLGAHPILLRNFSAALGIDYVAQYKQAGTERG